jgi:hypothetical protein
MQIPSILLKRCNWCGLENPTTANVCSGCGNNNFEPGEIARQEAKIDTNIAEGDGSRERPFVILTSSRMHSVMVQNRVLDMLFGAGKWTTESCVRRESQHGKPGNQDMCEFTVAVAGVRYSVWFDFHLVNRLADDPGLRKIKRDLVESPAGRKVQAEMKSILFGGPHALEAPKTARASESPDVSTGTRPTWAGLFRTIKMLAIAFMVLVMLAAFALYQMDQRQKAEFEASKHRITLSEIKLVDLELKPGYGSGFYELTGRIRNRSRVYTAGTVIVRLTMSDVQQAGTSEIVGDEDVHLYLNVPPGQTREVSSSVIFKDLPRPEGRLQWNYSVTEIHAR